MPATNNLILASNSKYRAQLLTSAGIDFSIHPANIDERAVEQPLLAANMCAADIALVLAQAKAVSVSETIREAFVIGSDQTLEFEGNLLHKPGNMEEARRRLLLLSGKTHQLHSCLAIAENGEVIWYHQETASIRFRKLDPSFVGRHLARVGEIALTSVGAYQIEGEGIQLFESIDGDFFSIMGLPLLSLLNKLRELELIDG